MTGANDMISTYEVKPYEKKFLTIGDLYEQYEACELTIRDYKDNFIIWCGDFEDMPIKYGCTGFKRAFVNVCDGELEVLI